MRTIVVIFAAWRPFDQAQDRPFDQAQDRRGASIAPRLKPSPRRKAIDLSAESSNGGLRAPLRPHRAGGTMGAWSRSP